MEWTIDRIQTSVDGRVYFDFAREPQGGRGAWPFDAPQHLLLNIAVGGNWGGQQGVDDATLERLRTLLTPGTSALFVLSSGARPEAVQRALAGTEATLVHAEMDEQTEAELRRLLGTDPGP